MYFFKFLLAKNPKITLRRFLKAGRVISKAIKGEETASNELPARLHIEVTDKCNFSCIMCCKQSLKNQRNNPNNEITPAIFSRILEEIKPVYVTLSGAGEPLLNKDICSMLKLCVKKEINTALPTNISIMNPQLLADLLQNPPRYLIFSFHAATPELFNSITSSQEFNNCVQNIELLLSKIDRKRTTVRMLCVLQTLNLEHYQEMFELVKKWGLLDNFVLATIFNYGPYYNKDVVPDLEKVNKALDALEKEISRCVQEDKSKFLKSWRQELLNLKYMQTMRVTGPCLLPWYSTYIKVNGDVIPCCYLENEDFVMGNITSSSFAEIWNGAKYREFRRILRDNRPVLKKCVACWNDQGSLVKKYIFFALGKTKWKV